MSQQEEMMAATVVNQLVAEAFVKEVTTMIDDAVRLEPNLIWQPRKLQVEVLDQVLAKLRKHAPLVEVP